MFEKNANALSELIQNCATKLRAAEERLTRAGYEVQTLRIATNPFPEWLYDKFNDSAEGSATVDYCMVSSRLIQLDSLLSHYNIDFCSLGPSDTPEATRLVCPWIVKSSPRFSCSADVASCDVDAVRAAADCILTIAQLGETTNDDNSSTLDYLRGGLGNFRFCASACCLPFIPFFPAAKSSSAPTGGGGGGGAMVAFAIGLENGALARRLLAECGSISKIGERFRSGMRDALLPVQQLCTEISESHGISFIGIDTSLNPSLDDGGSVADAIESLEEVRGAFGSSGTLAAAAAITTSLQSLPEIQSCGYSGLMLPVCEDRRLAELASSGDDRLAIRDLLSISSVCGVGVDTVPVPGNCSAESLTALILDVAGLAGRWNKSLSCRVFPVPGKNDLAMTEFDSPYLCNCRVFPLP